MADPAWKLTVKVASGSHNAEDELNRQLNDKERVAAAAENASLMRMVYHCIET